MFNRTLESSLIRRFTSLEMEEKNIVGKNRVVLLILFLELMLRTLLNVVIVISYLQSNILVLNTRIYDPITFPLNKTFHSFYDFWERKNYREYVTIVFCRKKKREKVTD